MVEPSGRYLVCEPCLSRSERRAYGRIIRCDACSGSPMLAQTAAARQGWWCSIRCKKRIYWRKRVGFFEPISRVRSASGASCGPAPTFATAPGPAGPKRAGNGDQR